MQFSSPEYWSGSPFPSPGDLPNPGIKPRSPTLQADLLPAEPQGKPYYAIKPLMNTWEEQQLVCLGAPEKAVERPALPSMNPVKLGGSETAPLSPPQEGRDGLSFQPPLLCPSVSVMPPPPTLVTSMTFFRSSDLLQRHGALAPQQIEALGTCSCLILKEVTIKKGSPEREMACPAPVCQSTSSN